MKIALWKEFRQTWKWGAALTALLALAQLTVIDFTGEPPQLPNIPIPVVGSIVGFPVLAILLAFVQYLPEQSRDRWSTTLHWPVSRITLFLRKTGAGLIIYLGATGLCVGFHALLFALPGLIPAPFIPGLYLPALVDIACGAMYYFAAVLIALPHGPARLIRGFVIPVVFSVHVYAVVAVSAWAAMGMALGLCAVIGLAGFGILTGNGAPKLEPRWCRAAMISLVSVGVLLFGLFVLVVTSLQKVWLGYGSADSPWGITICADALAPGGPRQDEVFHYTYRSPELWVDVIQGPASVNNMGRPNFPTITWFYRRDQALFVGYEVQSRSLYGYIGVNGFNPRHAGVVPFPAGTRSTLPLNGMPKFWWNAHALYRVDFSSPAVTTLFDDPAGSIAGIQGVQNADWYKNDPRDAVMTPVLAVALPHQLNLIDAQGTIRAIIPYPPEAQGRARIRISGISNWNTRLVFASTLVRPREWPGLAYLVTVSPIGADHRESDNSIPHEIPDRFGSRASLGYPAAALTPTVAVLAMAIHDATVWTLNFPGDPAGQLFASPEFSDWTFALFSAGCAALAWALARAGQIPRERRWRWVAFVFAMNIAGLLTFLMLAARPRLVRCPSCRRLRALDLEHCSHCSARWPEVVPTGAEIFEDDDRPLPAQTKAHAVA